MKHIVRAIILLIILFLAAQHYQDSEGVLGLIYVLFIIVFMYLVASIIGAIRKAIISRRQPALATTAKKSSGGIWLFLVILFFVLSFAFKEALGSYGFKAFLFLDNLVKLSATASPFIFWGILGLFTGAIYGSFVAWKKYKLHAAVNLIPVGILVLFVAIMYIVNKPQDATAFTAAHNVQTVYAYNLVTAEVYNVPADNNTNYKPNNLLDSNDKTAWITDIRTGNTPEVRFSFRGLQTFADRHLQCVGFIIRNGYRKSPQLWGNFARVKALAIKHNGSLITNAVINDNDNDSEEIKINPISISSFDNVSISINAVYPGEKYPDRVAISELVPIVKYEDVSKR